MYLVVVFVVVLAIFTVLYSQVRSAEQQRDAWKRVADDLAEAVRELPVRAAVGGAGGTGRGPTVQAARALARYNAMLEPEG